MDASCAFKGEEKETKMIFSHFRILTFGHFILFLLYVILSQLGVADGGGIGFPGHLDAAVIVRL